MYAIYSLMLTHPQTSHGPDDNRYLAIRDTTVPAYPRNPCIDPPKEYQSAFREVLADYERRQSTPRELRRSLSIPKAYELLNAEAVEGFLNGSRRPLGVTDLFSLSDVFFDSHRTLAITAIATWCGRLCGLIRWRVFEKLKTGEWEERPWVGCTAMSENREFTRAIPH